MLAVKFGGSELFIHFVLDFMGLLALIVLMTGYCQLRFLRRPNYDICCISIFVCWFGNWNFRFILLFLLKDDIREC